MTLLTYSPENVPLILQSVCVCSISDCRRCMTLKLDSTRLLMYINNNIPLNRHSLHNIPSMSYLFSSISFSAFAGLWITSPAAIRLTTASSRRLISSAISKSSLNVGNAKDQQL